MPESTSLIDAAAIWMQYSTAYNSMVNVAQRQKGEYVLLTAATSPVGIHDLWRPTHVDLP